MKQTTVEYIVYACMFLTIYHNWTDFPKPEKSREVRGVLEKTK